VFSHGRCSVLRLRRLLSDRSKKKRKGGEKGQHPDVVRAPVHKEKKRGGGGKFSLGARHHKSRRKRQEKRGRGERTAPPFSFNRDSSKGKRREKGGERVADQVFDRRRRGKRSLVRKRRRGVADPGA